MILCGLATSNMIVLPPVYLKVTLWGVIIAIVSEIVQKVPGFGALIASLPLISVLGMVWLWRDTNDPVRMADHAYATLWFVLPSLPMLLLIPFPLRQEASFWLTLTLGCVLTVVLYLSMVVVASKVDLKL